MTFASLLISRSRHNVFLYFFFMNITFNNAHEPIRNLFILFAIKVRTLSHKDFGHVSWRAKNILNKFSIIIFIKPNIIVCFFGFGMKPFALQGHLPVLGISFSSSQCLLLRDLFYSLSICLSQ